MTFTIFESFLRHKFKSQFLKIFRSCSSKVQITPKNDEWVSVVGLEVHAQINSKSKLFSSSHCAFGSATNTEVSYFDAALPGTLPVLNKYCIKAAIKTALALDCKVNTLSSFDRKHYFYPDLPSGYQITQQFHPIANKGKIIFLVYDEEGDPYVRTSNLKQLQLEQDSGRTFHVRGEKSFVDLNRAGIGLMELVFEPDLRNGKEASALLKELILILKRIGTCSCEMEEGTLRVDANISVNRQGEPLGTRTEVKNLNSLRDIARAIDYEIGRQIKVLEGGDIVVNETRTYDVQNKVTVFMRDKEVLQDYRFMPEPNLPPLCLCDQKHSDKNIINVNDIRKEIPVLPYEERASLTNKYKLSLKDADKLVNYEGAKDKFEAIACLVSDAGAICEFLFDILFALLNVRQLSFRNCPLTAKQLAEIVDLLMSRNITEATACDILEMLFNGDERSASEIVKEFNWYQINDEKELEAYCIRVMAARPKMVKKYRNSGKQRYMTSLLTFLYQITNNRAPYKESENMFKQLILKEEK